MLTPQEIYTELDISPATLRRWAAQFADYLSPQAHGKKRSYTVDDFKYLAADPRSIRSGRKAGRDR